MTIEEKLEKILKLTRGMAILASGTHYHNLPKMIESVARLANWDDKKLEENPDLIDEMLKVVDDLINM